MLHAVHSVGRRIVDVEERARCPLS